MLNTDDVSPNLKKKCGNCSRRLERSRLRLTALVPPIAFPTNLSLNPRVERHPAAAKYRDIANNDKCTMSRFVDRSGPIWARWARVVPA